MPIPDAGEDEFQIEESRILKEKDTCCLSKIRAAGEPIGISCQQLFERAYLRAGHSPTFARAVFALYIAFKGTGPMPLPVEAYIKLIAQQGYEERSGKEGFCAGCMLDSAGAVAFIGAYEFIEPRAELSKNIAGTGTLSGTDELYLDLLDSGALSQENESWQDVLDFKFEEPNE
jgi:hypothetical protein